MWKNVTWAFVPHDCSLDRSVIGIGTLLSVEDVSLDRIVPAADKKLVRKRKSVPISDLKGVPIRSFFAPILETKFNANSGAFRKSETGLEYSCFA